MHHIRSVGQGGLGIVAIEGLIAHLHHARRLLHSVSNQIGHNRLEELPRLVVLVACVHHQVGHGLRACVLHRDLGDKLLSQVVHVDEDDFLTLLLSAVLWCGVHFLSTH